MCRSDLCFGKPLVEPGRAVMLIVANYHTPNSPVLKGARQQWGKNGGSLPVPAIYDMFQITWVTTMIITMTRIYCIALHPTSYPLMRKISTYASVPSSLYLIDGRHGSSQKVLPISGRTALENSGTVLLLRPFPSQAYSLRLPCIRLTSSTLRLYAAGELS
jgi:hypothetical protein